MRTAISRAALAVYNYGVRRAVHAYAADQSVENGRCAVCAWRKRDGFRLCSACRRMGRGEHR